MKPYQGGGKRLYGPSPLHQWKVVAQPKAPNGSRRYIVEKCDRCERHFVEGSEAHGPIWCTPTKDWLAAHPGDEEQR